MIKQEDNMPATVIYYNKYINHIDGSIIVNYKHYAHIDCMCMMNDESYYIEFIDKELDKVFNSARLIASATDATVKFNVDDKEIILSSNTTFEEMENQLKIETLLILK
jgi:hypothetical protein